MLDRRQSFRRRVYYGARIAFNQRQSTLDCVVRNFSSLGARVELPNGFPLSDEIDFTIYRKGISFRGRMIWHRDDIAGFAFSDARPVPVPISLDWSLRLRANERAARNLQRQFDELRSGY